MREAPEAHPPDWRAPEAPRLGTPPPFRPPEPRPPKDGRDVVAGDPLAWPPPPDSAGAPGAWLPPPADSGRWPPGPGPRPGKPGASARTPGKATAALVLGVIGLFVCPFVCSVAAIILGMQARREIDADARLGGRGLATAGIALGVVALLVFALVIALEVGGVVDGLAI